MFVVYVNPWHPPADAGFRVYLRVYAGALFDIEKFSKGARAERDTNERTTVANTRDALERAGNILRERR